MIGYHSRGQQRAVTKSTLVLESAFLVLVLTPTIPSLTILV